MKKYDFFFNYFNVILFILKSDLIKRQRDFKIGLISIFLVVFFLTLLFNIIQISSCIFLKLSEQENGEIDLIITAHKNDEEIDIKKSGFDNFFYNKKDSSFSNMSTDILNNNFLNYYEIKEKLSNLSFIEGVSPRWYFIGKASKREKEKNESINFKTNILILDSSQENNMGIGRNLYLPDLKLNECYVSETLYNALKVEIGDEIQMDINIFDLIKVFTMEGDTTEDVTEAKNKLFNQIYDDDQNNEDKNENDIKRNHYKKKNNYKYTLKNNYNKKGYINNYNIYNNISFNPNHINVVKLLNKKENNEQNEKKNIKSKYAPIKHIFVDILNEYINNIIVDHFHHFLNILFFSKVASLFNSNDKNESLHQLNDTRDENNINETFIYNYTNYTNYTNYFNETHYEDLLEKYLIYDKNFNETYQNDSIIKRIIKIFLKKLIINNEKDKDISFNQDLFYKALRGNLTGFIESNIDYDIIFNENILRNLTNFLNIKINLTIKEKVQSTFGKWSSSLGNVLAIDQKHIQDYLYNNIKNILDITFEIVNIEKNEKIMRKTLDNYIEDFDINNFTLAINLIFKDKFQIYKRDINEIRYCISKIAGDIVSFLGLENKVNIKTPLYGAIKGYNKVKIFINNILYCIMVFLGILSIILVNSLMLGNVNERTYEFGMMRILGFKKDKLYILIILKGMSFSIPGIILGLTTSYITNNFISFLFNWYTGLVMPFFLSIKNILFGIVSGISIPLIGSYFPIKKCLHNNLRNSLTFFSNKKVNDSLISMIKLEKLGLSPSSLVSSITLIVIGLVTYYVVPFSYYQKNLSLFVLIMISILISMLLGLIMLSLLIVSIFQKILLKIISFIFSFCFFSDKNFNFIILKNLIGHKKRNDQVSIMLIISISFLIFSGCTLYLLVDFAKEFSQRIIGGDFTIYNAGKNLPNNTLNEISIKNYFQTISRNYPDLIKNYSFYSFDIKNIINSYNLDIKTGIGALNGYPLYDISLAGVDKTFIDSSQTLFYEYGEYDTKLNKSYSNGKIDLIKMMYNNKNVPHIFKEKNNTFIHPNNNNTEIQKLLKNFQLNILPNEGIKKKLGLSIYNNAQFKFLTSPEHSIPCKIIGFIDKFPSSLLYSSYEKLSKKALTFITNEQMKQLLDIESKIYNFNLVNLSNSTINGIRKKKLIVKFQDNANKELKQMVFFAMNNYLEGLTTLNYQILDIIYIADKIKNVIEYILLVIGVIALILSFFLVWISFYNNIRENIAEYGIMRSIGLTKTQNMKIYLYEAATIILTSIIIGTFIGIIISCSIVLQFDIFLEMPFIFHFPYKFYFILISVGLFLGLLGSYYPIYSFNNFSLAKIMKGLNH